MGWFEMLLHTYIFSADVRSSTNTKLVFERLQRKKASSELDNAAAVTIQVRLAPVDTRYWK